MNASGAIACKADWTLLVDSIRASSLNRLHKQPGQTTAPDQRPGHHFMLATREPSTENCRDVTHFQPFATVFILVVMRH